MCLLAHYCNIYIYDKDKIMNSYLKLGILSGLTVIFMLLTYKAGVEALDPIYAEIVKEHFSRFGTHQIVFFFT